MLVEFITKLDKLRMQKREKYGKLRAAANKGNKAVGHYKRIDRRKKKHSSNIKMIIFHLKKVIKMVLHILIVKLIQ
eukprot:UN04365